MAFIEFSDIIGIAIVIYVAILAKNNSHIKKDIKNGILGAGVALAILYVFDMFWYVIFYLWQDSARKDFALDFVTCIVYLMIPVGLSTYFIINIKKSTKTRYLIGLILLMIFSVADIANIFTPVFFYHENSVMVFEPFGLFVHLICLIAILIILADMVLIRSFDFEDAFLACFVAVTIFIGLMASWLNYDVKTLWISLGISYLLMYLAVSERYNKIDVITGLPTRNAYEKAISHIKNRYNSILMIDMNGLKHYNDTKGHRIGDKYIFATASTIADAFSGHGRLFRVGGDEFCLISNSSKEELSVIADKVLSSGKCSEKYGDFPIDFAYGIAERKDGEAPSEVYGRADQLMYENKGENRN